MPSYEPGRGGCCQGHAHQLGLGGGRGGLVEPAVLTVLTGGPVHGYDLRAALDEATCGFLVVDPGGLYRLLRRMEEDGLVTSAWVEGDHGPQRRTYQLTADGHEALAAWRPRLLARRHAIDNLLAVGSRSTTSSSEEETDDDT